MLNHKEQIGRLDRRITFQEKVIGENESNEDEETGWEDIATNPTVWASKDEHRGNEVYRADKLTDYLNVDFVCRYRSDITPKNRIVCESIPYNIISITEISRRRFLMITTETQEPDQWSAEVEGAFSDGFSDGFLI